MRPWPQRRQAVGSKESSKSALGREPIEQGRGLKGGSNDRPKLNKVAPPSYAKLTNEIACKNNELSK